MSNRVLLIDGNSFAWRAFHVGSTTTGLGLRSANQATGAVYVFLRMLRGLVDQVRPQRILVCWDSGVPEFRTKVWPSYKKRRKARADSDESYAVRQEFYEQIGNLRKNVIPYLQVSQVEAPGWEADDLVSYFSRDSSFIRSRSCVIVSGDKDLFQLVDDGKKISVWYLPTSTAVDQQALLKTNDIVSGREWLFYRILTGDSSDQIPSIGKVGDKTARVMLEKSRVLAKGLSLQDTFFQVCDSMSEGFLTKPRKKQFFINQILMDLSVSRKMLRREGDLGINNSLMQIADSDFDLGRLEAFFQQYEFRTLLNELASWSEPFSVLRPQ